MTGGENLDFEIRPNPQPVSAAERAALLADPGFGRVFTDHMVTIRYAEARAGTTPGSRPARRSRWTRPRRCCTTRRRSSKGSRRTARPTAASSLFRPEANARRFRDVGRPDGDGRSCPSELFLELARASSITIDREWIPTDRGGLASTCARSCSPARSSSACARRAEYLYVVIASPVGSYFKGGVKPVTRLGLRRSTPARRPGGTGAAKCGGNYAASLVAQAEAIEHGCDQVVFLDAVERRYVDELGGMNIFFVFDDGTHGHAAADRHDPARHHPRLGHHAGAASRPRRSRSAR